MPRDVPVVRVAACAVLLLGALAGIVVWIGVPNASGAGPLSLPNPVPISAVRYDEAPLKVLLVGDSMAGSLGVGLGILAAGYHVDLVNAGHPGCSVAVDGEVQLGYQVAEPGAPCRPGDPGHLLEVWRRWVDAFRPDVVVYLARTDLLNLEVDGRWTWVGRRAFNGWFRGRIREMLSVFTAHGAKVVLMTMPVSQETLSSSPPQDSPVRAGRLGKLLRLGASGVPGVEVYDLARLLTPGFHYRASVDGVPLRCADGVHLSPEAGVVVAADLFPRLWALVGAHRVAGGGHWVGGPIPPTTPTWYTKLSCA